LGQDYQYGDERIRVYTGSHDAPIIHALNMLVNSIELREGKFNNVDLIKTDPETIFDVLKGVRQYRDSSFSLEEISLTDDIYGLDLHIKEFRLTQVMQLKDAFIESGLDLFSPAAFQFGSGLNSIITPPILERAGDKLVLIEGSTRLYYALKNNYKNHKGNCS